VDQGRPLLLRHVGRCIRLGHWLHRRLLAAHPAKADPLSSLHSHHPSAVRLLLRGSPWIDHAPHSTLVIFLASSGRRAGLPNLHRSHHLLSASGEIHA
jgi:hypothetical protein